MLGGRVAVVTGGGGGIGRGISTRFASEGAAVVVAEIDADRAADTVATIESDGGTAVAELVDVCTPAGAQRAVDRAIAEFGRVDVLVNNVGHFGGARKSFHENTDDEWDELYQVNLGHVLRCTRGARAHARARRGREHRDRVDGRSLSRDPDGRCTRRSRRRSRASRAASPSSTRVTGFASTPSHPMSSRRSRFRIRVGYRRSSST